MPFVCAILLSPFCMALDSEPDLKKELEELKQGQQAIHKEIQELKSILGQRTTAQQPAAVNVKGVDIEIGSNPIKGNSDSKLIMIEITDHQCPYCGRYARETFPK